MKLRWTPRELHLRHIFRISRSAKSNAEVMIVELEHDGIIGLGEAAPIARYQESIDSVGTFLSKINLEQFDEPFEVERILAYINALDSGNTSAKCAVDLAVHDWIGKKLGIPLYKLWGFPKSPTPISSFTIGIDSIDVINQKVREAEEYPILKVKLGLDNDEEIINAIRRLTDKVVRVDANEGWKDRSLALKRVNWLRDQNIEFIEQPMPSSQLEDIKWLRDQSEIPFIADESVIRIGDIPHLAQAFDGINIKLMKCTGVREGLRMIHTAHAFGMKVMLGCMIESSIAISAAAHLSPAVEYADLDGNVLIVDDPYTGVRNHRGTLLLNDDPGFGVKLAQR